VARKPSPKQKPDLKVEVPSDEQDRPRLGRVGIVAGVGFALGIVFPWAAGVQLVPSVPAEDVPAAVAPQPSASAAAPPPVKPAPAPLPSAVAEPPAAERIKVGAATVTSCRDGKGAKVDSCDTPSFDGVARSRIEALATCPAAAQATGMLSLGFDVDFAQKKILRLVRGASTTISETTAEALVRCAEREFASASVDGITHAQQTYTIFYPVEFLPPAPPAAAEAPEAKDAGTADAVTAASGTATVAWTVAIVRDAPSKDAGRVARVAGGTRVTVVGRQNDWYKIKYDAKGNDGWVYKGALGL
jgi:hypothetical protein